MALRNPRHHRKLMADINVVPYIDVMLVLVVILMVAAPFVNPSVVNLPSVNKASKAPNQIVEVIVYPDQKLAIRANGKTTPVDASQLVRSVQSHLADGSETPVVILADKDVRYDTVIDTLKRLQAADIRRVGLGLNIESSR